MIDGQESPYRLVRSGCGLVPAHPASIVRTLHREGENAYTKEPLAETISGGTVEWLSPARFIMSSRPARSDADSEATVEIDMKGCETAQGASLCCALMRSDVRCETCPNSVIRGR